MVKKIKIDNETNELNYLFGGYFSAIGRIFIRKYKNKMGSYSLRSEVFFDDLKIAKLFQENFGGTVRVCKNTTIKHWRSKKGKVKNIRRHICWRTIDGGEFYHAIYPYIINKRMKKKIKIAIKYWRYQQQHFGESKYPVREQKHKYYLQMKRLK